MTKGTIVVDPVKTAPPTATPAAMTKGTIVVDKSKVFDDCIDCLQVNFAGSKLRHESQQLCPQSSNERASGGVTQTHIAVTRAAGCAGGHARESPAWFSCS
jgi:hypothetical protein